MCVYTACVSISECQAADIGHYDGETYRPAHCRFIQHYRSARNPGAKSYVDKPWAKHYKAHHTGCTEPKIGMKIVARASTTNKRKIKEARVILKNKKEQMDLRRFLV